MTRHLTDTLHARRLTTPQRFTSHGAAWTRKTFATTAYTQKRVSQQPDCVKQLLSFTLER